MANPNGRAENFKPLSKDEARKRGRAGGLASVKSRLLKRTMKEWALALRDAPSPTDPNMTRAQAAMAAAWSEAERGDVKALRFICELMGDLDANGGEVVPIMPPIVLGMIPADMVERAKADHEKRQIEKRN